MDFMAVYCEPGGVEVTVMPHVPLLDAPTGERLPSTGVALQSTTEILAKKLRHRLYESHCVEVRDVYDIAVARELSPKALRDAMDLLHEDHHAAIATLLSLMPDGWSRGSAKPLLEPRFAWGEDELVMRVMGALAPDGLDADRTEWTP